MISFGAGDIQVVHQDRIVASLEDIRSACGHIEINAANMMASLDLIEFTEVNHSNNWSNVREYSDFYVGKIRRSNRLKWREIAAKSGAIAIYNFGEALEIVKNKVVSIEREGKIPAGSKVSIQTEVELFKKEYPGHKAIRHMVGHETEMMLKENKKHASSQLFDLSGVVIKASSVMISGLMIGREFHVTYQQKFFSYELNGKSTKCLCDLASRVVEKVTEMSRRYSQ